MAGGTGGGASPRRWIVGLGNPGERYTQTRHNVGFRVVEELARRESLALASGECNCVLAQGEDLGLVMPQTFMNRSGFATRCLRERHELAPEDFLIVYDEVHLPLGSLRLRPKGSPAGHRGMESVLENFGTDQVPRLRLGVEGASGPPEGSGLVDFVLEDFLPEESTRVEEMISLAADACLVWAEMGSEAAMQRFNRKVTSEAE